MNPKLRAAVLQALATAPSTYEDIAKFVGVSRESVEIAVRALRREGVVLKAGVRRDCTGQGGSAKTLWSIGQGIVIDPEAVAAYHTSVPDEQRFWSRVDKNGPTQAHLDTACWVWTGGKMAPPFDYGQFYNSETQQNEGAHRVSWRMANGKIPEGASILHHCDYPSCVNPDHLYAGSDSDNRLDAIRRGRDNTARGNDNGSRTRPERRAKAESHGMSKLTWEKVDEIRVQRAQGETLQALAEMFGVSSATIHAVVHRKRWVR